MDSSIQLAAYIAEISEELTARLTSATKSLEDLVSAQPSRPLADDIGRIYEEVALALDSGEVIRDLAAALARAMRHNGHAGKNGS